MGFENEQLRCHDRRGTMLIRLDGAGSTPVSAGISELVRNPPQSPGSSLPAQAPPVVVSGLFIAGTPVAFSPEEMDRRERDG
jgi:predicted aconitase with swiveling domain